MPVKCLASGGGRDAFVAKLNRDGDRLFYRPTSAAVARTSAFGGIAVDNPGNAYVTGYTLSTDFPTVGAVSPPPAGVKTPSWRNSIGTATGCSIRPTSAAVESTLAVESPSISPATSMSRGERSRPTSPTVGAVQPASGGGQDAFVAKLGR